MSIYNYLSENQINKILSIIQERCDCVSRNDNEDRKRISSDYFDLIRKGRKAHDITADIYCACFFRENAIDGLNLNLVKNGFYSQPEYSNDDVIVHIYHESNKLDSKLVNDCKNDGRKFFCLKYSVDKHYRLISIESFDILVNEKEIIYTAPRLVSAAG